jgi:acyl-CoA synthetase (AMP-forming)/AMP-acid ligase II/acyl carrier protein
LKTIHDILVERAISYRRKKAFIFLSPKGDALKELSYMQLAQKVIALGALMSNKGWSQKRVLLLYSESYEFIISFLACQSMGAIAIPMFPPRGSAHTDRLLKILEDVQPDVIFTTEEYFERTEKIVNVASVTSQPIMYCPFSEELPPVELGGKRIKPTEPVSFIQYTSGSTGQPKGVIITHENILHNQSLIQNAFECTSDSIIGCWLPFYHDMGLIGNILHTIFTGATCILLSPFAFFQQPALWLEMISNYKVTHSGAPNFAYDLCVDSISTDVLKTLDLSSWQVAYNGSEPVRSETMQKFSDFFKTTGFKKESFSPCYGLAEAALLVSGKKEDGPHKIYVDESSFKLGKLKLIEPTKSTAKALISSGSIAEDMHVKIIDTVNKAPCGEFELGEICIAGPSISMGYWNGEQKPDPSGKPEGELFHTGDIGFTYGDHLFVVGRIKEMLIIRGKNYYPYDIEQYATLAHPAIEKNGVAAFSTEIKKYSELVIVAEIKRKYMRLDITKYHDILQAIKSKIIQEVGIRLYHILLLKPLSIPRTSSGKIKRLQCVENYDTNAFEEIFAFRSTQSIHKGIDIQQLIAQAEREPSDEHIARYVEAVFAAKSISFNIEESRYMDLAEIGIDSLKATEIVNTMNEDLQINLDITIIYQNNTVSGLLNAVQTRLWFNRNMKREELYNEHPNSY